VQEGSVTHYMSCNVTFGVDWDSSVGVWLGCGPHHQGTGAHLLAWVRDLSLFQSVHTSSEAHPAFYLINTVTEMAGT